MGLFVLFNGSVDNTVKIVLEQINDTGVADYNLYGTGAAFAGVVNDQNVQTTPLGSGQLQHNGTTLLPLSSGGPTGGPATETIGAVSGVLTLTFDASTGNLTGYYNQMLVGSIALTDWGSNPTLTLAVVGFSGEGVNVPAGTDTASGFFAGLLQPPGITGTSLSALNLVINGSNGQSGGTYYVLAASTNIALPLNQWTPVATLWRERKFHHHHHQHRDSRHSTTVLYSPDAITMKKAAMRNNIICLALLPAMGMTQAAGLAATNTPSAIPWNEIGAKAGADYKGDGLAVTPTGSGARLHCVFQRLDGEATAEGLWLTSTVTNTVSDRFRVTAMAVGRKAANATFNFQSPESSIPLAGAGEVSVCGQTVRFSRPGLTEEYSVSMDGVRQDFIVEQAPLSPPGGELVVKLAVTGAQVEPAADGARLVLANSGRKIAYSRLRVTDATGKELPARIEVCHRRETRQRVSIPGPDWQGY